MTVKQAAELLQVSPRTIYGLCSNGLRHYRIGTVIRIDAAELKAFLEKQHKGATVTPPPKRVRLNHLRLDP